MRIALVLPAKNRTISFLFSFALAVAAHGAVVSRDWGDGKLTLKLDDGAAEMEWISPVAFRFARILGRARNAGEDRACKNRSGI